MYLVLIYFESSFAYMYFKLHLRFEKINKTPKIAGSEIKTLHLQISVTFGKWWDENTIQTRLTLVSKA